MASSRTDQILAVRDRVVSEKIAHDQRVPFLDFVSIALAALGGPWSTAFDKSAAKLTPDLTASVAQICDLAAAMSGDLEQISDDRERLEATLDLVEKNSALQDRLIAIVKELEEPGATIETSDGASQSFRDVVFENLSLHVKAESGGKNLLDGVEQSGQAAHFQASGDGSDNEVKRSSFTGDRSKVVVDGAHLRSASLNTPDAAMEIRAGQGERSVGLMIGGDGRGAAVWIPAKRP